MAKLLRSLNSLFDNKVTAIEVVKDLSKLTVEQLCGSMQAHKAWINNLDEKMEEKALRVEGGNSGAREYGR